MLSAQKLVELHDRRTREWHETGSGQASAVHGDGSTDEWSADDWLGRVAEQHRANFELWHIEDEARTPGASDAQLADVKHRVDSTNQRRNDLAEQLDQFLLAWLQERDLPNCKAALNSESPGLIVDRLSILALKIYHTRAEAERPGAPEGHAARNRERLALLEQQRTDLASCLDALWQETMAGTRRFKLYRQLKMYNDPDLNPAIYGQVAARTHR
jgi:Protein of unknown function (DUF4254)